jgi:prophage maintenance system killer protein
MNPRVEKIKPDGKLQSKPIDLRVCNSREGEFWYPPEGFIVEAHEIMIKRYGGYTGFEVGLSVYRLLLDEIKKVEGVYCKAALLLQGIAIGRIFRDGNHRTAYIVTKTFLEMNNGEIKENDDSKVIKFIKDIRSYEIEQIKSWLKDGTL